MPVTLKNPFFDLSMLITSPLDTKSRAGIIGDSDLSDEGVCNGEGALRPALPLLEKATVRSSKEVLERYVSFSLSAKTKIIKDILIKILCCWIFFSFFFHENENFFFNLFTLHYVYSK